MSEEQLQDLIKEMEDRAIEFDKQSKILSSTYFQGKANEARFVIEKIKHIMEQ